MPGQNKLERDFQISKHQLYIPGHNLEYGLNVCFG